MSPLIRLVLLAVCAASLASCVSRGGPVPYERTDFGEPDVPLAGLTDEYRVAPSDVLAVQVFGVQEYTGDYMVDDLGRIRLPLIGNVAVSGKTTDEVSAQLTASLGERLLQSPTIQVQLKAANSRRFTIDGAVTAPGIYQIGIGKISLVQAIATAKGLTDSSNPRRVVIFRTINGQRMAAAFDMTSIRKGENPDPPVYSNDIILVDGSNIRKNFQTFLQTVPLLGLFVTRF